MPVEAVKLLSDRVKVGQTLSCFSFNDLDLWREIDKQLSDGNSIPQLGLGVYEMSEKETYESVKWALQAGYKHIDTAEWYVLLPRT